MQNAVSLYPRLSTTAEAVWLDIEAQREAVNRLRRLRRQIIGEHIEVETSRAPDTLEARPHLSARWPRRARRDAPSSLRSSTACRGRGFLLQA